MNKSTIVGILVVILAVIVILVVTNRDEPVSDESTPDTTEVSEEAAEIMDGTYVFSPEESVLRWEGTKPLVSGYIDQGSIDLASGELVVEEGMPQSGEVVIDMESIRAERVGGESVAGSDRLEGHLKSNDFFSVETYPQSTFTITSITPTDETAVYEVTGELIIKGTTNQETFPVTITQEDGEVIVEADVTVDRSLYDVRFGSGSFFEDLGDNLISDEFDLDISLVGEVRESAE